MKEKSHVLAALGFTAGRVSLMLADCCPDLNKSWGCIHNPFLADAGPIGQPSKDMGCPMAGCPCCDLPTMLRKLCLYLFDDDILYAEMMLLRLLLLLLVLLLMPQV